MSIIQVTVRSRVEHIRKHLLDVHTQLCSWYKRPPTSLRPLRALYEHGAANTVAVNVVSFLNSHLELWQALRGQGQGQVQELACRQVEVKPALAVVRGGKAVATGVGGLQPRHGRP